MTKGLSHTDFPLPPLSHLAIIMDGNGRWAKERGLSRSEGHAAGSKTARTIIEACARYAIPHLTLYTFSAENWKRPASEVAYLFSLLSDYIHSELPNLERNNVKLHILGETGTLPYATRKALDIALHKTSQCTGMTLHLALNYSSRDEIARACRLCLENNVSSSGITSDTIQQYLYTKGVPDPDLVIRTSGEYRLSNFLLFQSAYSEFYFTDTYWPDFTAQELHTALLEYCGRSRRFGAIEI